MTNSRRYFHALVEIMFVRITPEDRSFKLVEKIALYLVAALFFYLPIAYFVMVKCADDFELMLYVVMVLLVHILAKFMLCNSKRIRRRFSTIKTRKHFLFRTWLIIEYVIFMWLVYLVFPLTCILIPCSLVFMAVENLLGASFIFNLFLNHTQQYTLWGGIVSYVLFIVADGYNRLRQGFLPDYLGLYAALTVISRSIESGIQQLLRNITVDMSYLSSGISQIFRISNDAMFMVASVLTFFFAIYSLYTTYNAEDAARLEEEELEAERREAHPKPAELDEEIEKELDEDEF